MLARSTGRVPLLASTLCPRRRLLVTSFPLLRYNSSSYPFHSCLRRSSTLAEKKPECTSSATCSDTKNYRGPLSVTFKRLKLFSLGSLGLSMAVAPFMFVIESSLPVSARLALVSIAIGTSGLSTALVSWVARPYVHTLKRLTTNDGREGLEMITYSFPIRMRITRVYDPYFLIETRRPFAKWELAKELDLPPDRSLDSVVPGKEETVAETLDDDETIRGRWIVQWDENGRGRCHEAGPVVRHFNVHEELL